MNSRAFRDVVEVQELILRNDLDGEPVDEWQTVNRLDAEIWNMRGTELFEAKQKSSDINIRIRTRWFPTANARQRLKADHSIYNVVTVVDLNGRRRFLEWDCSEEQFNDE